jgi:hypothetical protein
MTKQQFDEKQYDVSFTAGMNQRYHQSREHYWTRWDRFCKILVAVLAITGVCFSVVAWVIHHWVWDAAAVSTAGAAAIAAIILNVLPLGDWARTHQALFQRWTDLREDVDVLGFMVEGEPTDDQLARLRDLEAKVHRICGAEPGCNEALLDKSYEAEKQSRTPDAMACV